MTRLNELATKPDPLDGAITSAQILTNNYPPVEYVVPGIFPEGLIFLVASPKIGKSWMVLGIGVAAAAGGTALGSIPVDKRPVLYLALEDGERRLQSRLHRINAQPDPSLSFMTSLDGHTPGEVIGTYLERHGHQKPLVILDTLGKVRGVSTGNDQYGRDYTQMSGLKALVDAHPGSALLVVHHTRKGDSQDFLDAVSGTQGLAGAADTIALIRRERNTGEATLQITSRDAAEGEYAVTMTDGVWSLEGSTLAEAALAVGTREAKEGVGDTMQQILDVVARYPDGIAAKEVPDLAGVDPATARQYLKRAVDSGRINRPRRGWYTPVTTVTSVTTHLDRSDLVTNVPLVTPPEGRTCAREFCDRSAADGNPECQHHIDLKDRFDSIMANQNGEAA